MITAQGILYKNMEDSFYVDEVEVSGKKYLVKDSLPKIDWVITKESKEILGYTTYKATAVFDHKREVTAWYAPKLSYKNGPDKYWGLPGLILELEESIQYEGLSKEGTVYKATEIRVDKKNRKISQPVKGNIINETEYKALTDKQMEMYMDGEGVDKSN